MALFHVGRGANDPDTALLHATIVLDGHVIEKLLQQ